MASPEKNGQAQAEAYFQYTSNMFPFLSWNN